MLIRKFKETDAEEVSKLIHRVFNEFVAETFPKHGAKNWLKHETPQNVLKRSKERAVFVAVSNKKIVGMVESDGNRIRRLFVDEYYQRRDLGARLFIKMEKMCMKKKPRYIKIYSSVNAVGFYGKMGYRKFGRVRENKEGIVYQLMIKKFL